MTVAKLWALLPNSQADKAFLFPASAGISAKKFSFQPNQFTRALHTLYLS